MSRSHLFLLFLQTATVALHSRTRFSAVPHIIPASQVLSENPTADNLRVPESIQTEQALRVDQLSSFHEDPNSPPQSHWQVRKRMSI